MHVYFHVPFCTRRCSYCDFAIAVRRNVPSDTYLKCVLKEWDLRQAHPVWARSAVVETIYFGGGTPSKVSPNVIGQLLDRVAQDRAVSPKAEITLEANPEDVTAANAFAWRSAGVNRVSLGVQSFDPTVLTWMHRTHGREQIPHAVESLRRAGIANLSLDLIFGLPAALERNWPADLANALALQPEHLSLYGLTIEAHTPLGHWAGRGEATPVQDERYAAEFLQAHATLVDRGFDHYEVSNAARPGFRARHNSAYWLRAPFIGLGPSAHSGFDRERSWNIREWAAYERALIAGMLPEEGREVLDSRAVQLEELYLGLRTSEGLPVRQVPEADFAAWQSEGWATVAADRVRLTAEGWLRLDALVGSIAGRLATTSLLATAAIL